MAIFSSIGSALSSAAKYVSDSASKLLTSTATALGVGSSQTAPTTTATNYSGQKFSTPNSYSTPQTYSTPATYASYATKLPVTISANSSSLRPTTTQTARTTSAPVAGSSTAPIGSATFLGGTSPIKVPQKPSYVNPGTVNTTRLAGTVADLYTRNPQTGVFELANREEKTTDALARERVDLYKEIVGEPKNVYEDRQVIEARNERQRIQQALQAPTSELNAVIAKQNQDLLQLRQTGSQEGVTEAVYGGQANAINYNAAIRALPLQASIASLQGDLKLAQDYLTELTQIKSEQIKTQYEYNKNLFNSIEGVLDKADQRKYDELKTANDRAYSEQQNLIKTQGTLLQSAVSQGAPQSVITRISNATSIQDAIIGAGEYAGDIVEKQIKDAQLTKLRTDAVKAMKELNAPAVGTGVLAQAQAKGNIELISGLANDDFLASAVGPNTLARTSFFEGFTGGRANFVAGVQALVSQLTIKTLQDAKSSGATFGALSDAELALINSSATKIANWAKKDTTGKVIGYETSENEFKKELYRIANFAKLDYLLKGGNLEDVDAKKMDDGTIWTQNSDGSLTQIYP